MSQRYFSHLPIAGDRALLADSEAHHLIHVMRAAPGDRIVLFDGSGCEFDASVARIGRREVEFEILARRAVDREAHTPLTLAVALPKGDRARWLVEKGVELGVARIIPLVTQRSTSGKEKGSEKLDRFVVEASKQCGRNRLMKIASPVKFVDLVRDTPADVVRLLAHRTGGDSFAIDKPVSPVLAAVGPEGGFSDAEVQAALAAGWHCVSLSPRILRIETAALAIAARLVE
jgi:16S rRNA (uracil1498-N3)-methyltransferase